MKGKRYQFIFWLIGFFVVLRIGIGIISDQLDKRAMKGEMVDVDIPERLQDDFTHSSDYYLRFTADDGQVFQANPQATPYYYELFNRTPIIDEGEIEFRTGANLPLGNLYCQLQQKRFDGIPQQWHHKYKVEESRCPVDLEELLEKSRLEGADTLFLAVKYVDTRGNFLHYKQYCLLNNKPLQFIDFIEYGPFVSYADDTTALISFVMNQAAKVPFLFKGGYEINEPPMSPQRYIAALKANDSLINFKLLVNEKPQQFRLRVQKRTESAASFLIAGGLIPHAQSERYGALDAGALKKIFNLSDFLEVQNLQFVGDLFDSKNYSPQWQQLQYQHFYQLFPVADAPSVSFVQGGKMKSKLKFSNAQQSFTIDAFPYDEHDANALYSKYALQFSGISPVSVDGIPELSNTVYHWQNGPAAMLVLNSSYNAVSNAKYAGQLGMNSHLLLDSLQLDYLYKMAEEFEKDDRIQHYFISVQHPMLYAQSDYDSMLQAGLPKEILLAHLQQRDQILARLANKSNKFAGFFSDGEHNYQKLVIDSENIPYPAQWKDAKPLLNRQLFQFCVPSAGEYRPLLHVQMGPEGNRIQLIEADNLNTKEQYRF